MNRLLLYLIMLPSGLWSRLGADPVQLRAILNVKLILDDRKPLGIGRAQKRKDQRFRSVWAMVISFFTGLMCSLPLWSIHQLFSGLWSYFSFFILLLTITLITDFSSVLVDTKDKYVLLPRPISDRTFFLSRTLHIFIYLFRIVLPMALPGWITLGFVADWKAVLWFPVPMLAMLFTSLFFVFGVYLLILRIASASKFREVLSYFQIGFSVIIFGVYNLMPRVLNSVKLQQFEIGQLTWAPFLPTYWLAATFSWVTPLRGGMALPLFGLLALLFPALCIWITLRFLAPRFNSILGELDDDVQESGTKTQKAQVVRKSRRTEQLATLLNRRPEAQAGFLLTWIQTARSRTFKMKVYPVFAYVPIYFLYLILQNRRPVSEVFEGLAGTAKHLLLLYLCSMVMLSAFTYLSISEQYKAAWVYRAMPIREPGAVMAGAFKVIWIKYFLPFFAVISLIVLYIWGWSAVSDIALALANATLFAAVSARLMHRRFPFSQFDPSMKGGSRFFKSLLGMIVPLTMGGFHYLALELWWLKMLFFLLSIALLYLVWESYSHTSWGVILQEEDGITSKNNPKQL